MTQQRSTTTLTDNNVVHEDREAPPALVSAVDGRYNGRATLMKPAQPSKRTPTGHSIAAPARARRPNSQRTTITESKSIRRVRT